MTESIRLWLKVYGQNRMPSKTIYFHDRILWYATKTWLALQVGCPRSGQPITKKWSNHSYSIVFIVEKVILNAFWVVKIKISTENGRFWDFRHVFTCHFYLHDASRWRPPSNESLDYAGHFDTKIKLQTAPAFVLWRHFRFSNISSAIIAWFDFFS